MITRDQLQTHLRDLLQTDRFRDYAPNGLQVEGKAEIRRILTAVTASQAAITAAIDWQADALLVHHGYFWKGEAPQVVGLKKRRLAALLAHELNLFAYHLPLDQHPELGNNAHFAKHFACEAVWQSAEEPLIWHARIAPTTLPDLLAQLEGGLEREPFAVGTAADPLTHIAWCSGAAQDFLQQAADEGRPSSAVNMPSAATTKRGRRARCISPAAIMPANAPASAPWASISPRCSTCNSAFLMKKIPFESRFAVMRKSQDFVKIVTPKYNLPKAITPY